MQVAKDLPAKLIAEIIKSKESGETTQSSMISLISKTIKVLANPTRRSIFLGCLNAPKEFDRNPTMLYHLRTLEDFGIIKYTNKGYTPTNFSIELWNNISELSVIPNSTLSIEILLSLASEPKKFTELKKNLKVNEGSIFRALNFLISKNLIVKDANHYNLTSLKIISKLNILVSNYVELVKNASYDDSSESITIPKEEEIKILDLFEKKNRHIKENLLREEDLINDHIIISYSYSSQSEKDEIINSILKEQCGSLDSKYIKPLQTFEKNTVKFAYETNYVKSLQNILNLSCLHAIRIFDALMIEDINFPNNFIKNFKGPKFGKEGIRKLLDVKERPLLQITFLPEENLNIQTVKKLSKKLFASGVDEMSDNQVIVDNIKNFRERVEVITQLTDDLKNDFGRKIYYFYIYGEDYESRLDILKEMNSKNIGIGLSPITLGFPLTSHVINICKYPTQFHLTLHAPFTRYAKRRISKEGEVIPGFGISMNILLKFFVLLGGDEIHVDSPVHYHFEDWETKIQCDILNYYFRNLKKPFPILVGGINPINTPLLIKNYGNDIILKATTSNLTKIDKLGFSIEKSVNAFKQAIEIAVSEEKEIAGDKYKDYTESLNFYKK